MELEREEDKSIVVHEKINKSHLKQNQYTVLLLNEALRVGLLDLREINEIQVQTMSIEKDIIMRYTRGDSSSVTTDTAVGLLNSIFYCIDAYNLSCGSPEEAIEHMKTKSMKEIYEKGVECVEQWLEETKSLYREIRRNKLDVQIESYNLMIHEAIPIFLKKYGIVFEAHNAIASIDYPLVFDDMTVRGVLYIKNYLEHLKIETEFCKHFSSGDIEKMLSSFGKMIRMDYKIELINIFELVFNNAIFSVLLGNTGKELLISKNQFDLLNKKLKSLSADGIGIVIRQAVKRLIDILNITDTDLLDYIHRYEPNLAKRIENAVSNDSLSSVVITEKEESTQSRDMIFKEGEQMSDAKFKSLIKKLMKLSEIEDKINLIKSSMSSLHDFIDIMNSDCLYGDEFGALFDKLGDMELAILAKMVFYEELRNDYIDFVSVISDKTDAEAEWQMNFVEFMQKLSNAKIKSIEKCLDEIDYEEIKFN